MIGLAAVQMIVLLLVPAQSAAVVGAADVEWKAAVGVELHRRRLADSNTCRYAYDGDCDDGGRGSRYSYCSLGTDTADCGPRSPLHGDSNTCRYANDGECDDGGSGSHHSYCSLGTDTADCGPRYNYPTAFPTSHPTPPTPFPTRHPSAPTKVPTREPTAFPTAPTVHPTGAPSHAPTSYPTAMPTPSLGNTCTLDGPSCDSGEMCACTTTVVGNRIAIATATSSASRGCGGGGAPSPFAMVAASLLLGPIAFGFGALSAAAQASHVDVPALSTTCMCVLKTAQPTAAPTAATPASSAFPTASPTSAHPTAVPTAGTARMGAAEHAAGEGAAATSLVDILFIVLCVVAIVIALTAVVVAATYAISKVRAGSCRERARRRAVEEAVRAAVREIELGARDDAGVVGGDVVGATETANWSWRAPSRRRRRRRDGDGDGELQSVGVVVEPPRGGDEEMELAIAASLREAAVATCCVCLDAEPVALFVPCGHRCVCVECSERIMGTSRACPMCRAGATQAVRVYP